MKPVIFVLSAIILNFCQTANAQETNNGNAKGIFISDVYVQTGTLAQRNISAGLADFKKLAPESVLLNNDLSDFDQSNGFHSSAYSNFAAAIGVGFKNSTKRSLKLGINYFSGRIIYADLRRDVKTPYDTFRSSQSGEEFYVSKINSQSYNMYYVAEQLRLDASYIYRFNPQARLSVFAGFGASAGVSINSFVEVLYDEYDRTETEDISGNSTTSYFNHSRNNFDAESFNTKGSFGASAYIPLGLDFRLGKRSNFLQKTHLYYEMRPGINFTQIADLNSFINANMQQNLGLRFSLN